jgi:zinc/manganese transport system permease protein
MTELLSLMWLPFVASLILVGIHAYLGIHVLARGIIFVDLALAQIAALGSTFAVLAGYELESSQAYIFSLIATLIGAGVFTFSRGRKERVPQEAIIGIVYAVASAAAILTLDRAPHGAEQIKSLLVGSILWVSWPEVVKLVAICGVGGVFHWVFRKKFLLISFEPEGAREQSRFRFWDFLFYASFGLVVTSAVRIAGVLLVFSFLIVPAVCGFIFAERMKSRLFIAWLIGILGSVLGCILSYKLDLPTGATVVCTFGAILLGCAVIAGLSSLSVRDQSR